MPSVLREISGITLIGDHRFAYVQDEVGKIFIFNTARHTIEKEIPFGDAGDYKASPLSGATAYQTWIFIPPQEIFTSLTGQIPSSL